MKYPRENNIKNGVGLMKDIINYASVKISSNGSYLLRKQLNIYECLIKS